MSVSNLQIFGSWQELVDRIGLSAGTRVISIDLFDTLLFRCVDPEHVPRRVAAELCRFARSESERTPERLYDLRVEAFTEAARINAAAGQDFQASLRQSLPGWLETTGGLASERHSRLVDRLEELEVCFEIAVCRANPVLAAWISRVKQSLACKVVFCSDMYLPGSGIERLLAQVGVLDLFDDGYVSSEIGLLKETGRLFGYLCDELTVDPHEVLHIGDRRDSDGQRALDAGLSAAVVENGKGARGRFAGRGQGRQGFSMESPSKLSSWLTDCCREGSTLRLIGAQRSIVDALGPALCAYVAKLCQRARGLGVRRVLFLSREGHLLAELFNRMQTDLDDRAPHAQYLLASRQSTLLAAATRYDQRVLRACLRNHPYPTVRTLFSPFAISEETLLMRAEAHGFADLDVRIELPLDSGPVRALLNDSELSGRIRDECAEARSLLEDYLRQQGVFGEKRVVLADVGWSGQIQDNLWTAYGGRPDFPELFGLYFGVRREVGALCCEGNWFEGLVCDQRVPDWHAQAIWNFPQGLEELIRAPHGTVMGYTRDSGVATPALRDENSVARQIEKDDEIVLAPLQQALIEWAATCSALTVWDDGKLEGLMRYGRASLSRLFRHPNREEYDLITGLRNVCDLGLDTVVPLSGESIGHALWQCRPLATEPALKHWIERIVENVRRSPDRSSAVLTTPVEHGAPGCADPVALDEQDPTFTAARRRRARLSRGDSPRWAPSPVSQSPWTSVRKVEGKDQLEFWSTNLICLLLGRHLYMRWR